MRGAVSRKELEACGAGFLITHGEHTGDWGPTGIVRAHFYVDAYGIRNGRAARRVRRCLRRAQQRMDASLSAQGLPTGEHMTAWRKTDQWPPVRASRGWE